MMRSPFSRQADASAPPPLIQQFHRPRVHEVARGVEPRQRRGDATARAGFGEAVPEHRFHFRAVLVAEPLGGKAEQQSIAVHLTTVARRSLGEVGAKEDDVSPERGLSRDLATLTSAASRSVSAASARWPARVSR